MDSSTHHGLANIAIQVYSDAGALVTTGVTNESGVLGKTLAPGFYRVQIVPPADHAWRAIQSSSADAEITAGSTVTINVTVIAT